MIDLKCSRQKLINLVSEFKECNESRDLTLNLLSNDDSSLKGFQPENPKEVINIYSKKISIAIRNGLSVHGKDHFFRVKDALSQQGFKLFGGIRGELVSATIFLKLDESKVLSILVPQKSPNLECVNRLEEIKRELS